MVTTTALPHWDMTVVYPGLDSPEFARGFQAAVDRIAALAEMWDRLGIGKPDDEETEAPTVEMFEDVLRSYAGVVEQVNTLGAYIHAFVSTDSRDALAQARRSELQRRTVLLAQLETRLTAWLGHLDVGGLIEQSSLAREHAFLLLRTKVAAEHLMSPSEEALAAELEPSGGSAWGRLHANLTSQIMVPMDGEERPMTVVRNLAFSPDREVRRQAYEAELTAWERAALPLAAALNSIKGESNVLETRRGWESPLDVALFNNNIDRQTLDAMLGAAEESFPVFRRYLRAKARLLGVDALPWYDLFAPAGETSQNWAFDQARDFLLAQFGSYSDRLRSLAERAFNDRWIDAEPHPGKVGGAFCMKLQGDQSRILANYEPSYDGMSTLAHELGHAYHNFDLAARPPLLRTAPMTLAETASIFCQTIVKQAALEGANPGEALLILEASLQDSCQVVVDITSRFLFERGVFERRRDRELSVDELNEIMLDAQRRTYGDGLDANVLHPYMWAVKGHYYSTSRPFYNFPYMFGLLFGLGLYAHYAENPDSFRAGYDDLLSSTGQADAATLASGFGIDIRSRDFWARSLGIVAQDVERFEALVDGTGPR